MTTTVPVQGSDTDKGGDLPAVEGAEFGESTDRVKEETGPTPGTFLRRRSLSFQRMLELMRSSISRSRSSSS